MATNRDSAVIGITFRIPAGFGWDSEDAISALRGGSTISDVVEWTQGDPQVASFALSDISILFFSDSAGTTAIATTDDEYDIGDQTLADIITLGSFVDNADGTGSVTVSVDPSGISTTELTALRNVYIKLRVSQPDAGD